MRGMGPAFWGMAMSDEGEGGLFAGEGAGEAGGHLAQGAAVMGLDEADRGAAGAGEDGSDELGDGEDAVVERGDLAGPDGGDGAGGGEEAFVVGAAGGVEGEAVWGGLGEMGAGLDEDGGAAEGVP